MASITTQNVAAAVATVIQPSPSVQARQATASLQPGQIIQASQISAQQQSHVQKRKDDARSTQVPKRAEGGFSVQREAPHRNSSKAAKQEEEEESAKKNTGMDVVA